MLMVNLLSLTSLIFVAWNRAIGSNYFPYRHDGYVPATMQSRARFDTGPAPCNLQGVNTFAPRLAVWALLLASIVLAADRVEAGPTRRDTASRLRDAAAALDALEKAEDAEAARGDILVARGWVDEGVAHLRKGRAREAALLAERIPSQLQLINAVLTLARVRKATALAQDEFGEIERRIAALRARQARLILERDGPHATLAYPRSSGGGSDE
jgi:uncharacterized protein YicC (UPF0701 family)